MDEAKRKRLDETSGKGAYVAPQIEWEEPLEDAGVYAACAKDPEEPIGPGCVATPMSGAS